MLEQQPRLPTRSRGLLVAELPSPYLHPHLQPRGLSPQPAAGAPEGLPVTADHEDALQHGASGQEHRATPKRVPILQRTLAQRGG